MLTRSPAKSAGSNHLHRCGVLILPGHACLPADHQHTGGGVILQRTRSILTDGLLPNQRHCQSARARHQHRGRHLCVISSTSANPWKSLAYPAHASTATSTCAHAPLGPFGPLTSQDHIWSNKNCTFDVPAYILCGMRQSTLLLKLHLAKYFSDM